jgi:hypothetical protein
MRKPGFLTRLREQLDSLTHEELERLNRHGGLSIESAIDLLLNPCPRGADVYISAHRHVQDITSSSELPRYGVLLYVSEHVDLRRKDLKEFVDTCSVPLWVSYPRDRQDEVSSTFHGSVLLPQFEFLAFTPDNLLIDGDRLRPCGSGDAIVSLIESDSYRSFLNDGGQHIYYIDLESRCFVDRSVLAHHTETFSNVTVPVMRYQTRDMMPALCEIDRQPQLLEEFLFLAQPECFDYVHSGHMVFKTSLRLDMIRWNWIRRKVSRNNGLETVFKRYSSDITEAYNSQFVEVSRDLHFPTKEE